MRNAEQFESESAVWQVKNASRLTYRDPSGLAKAYPSLRVAFSHLQMGQMEGWKTSLSFQDSAYFQGRTVSFSERRDVQITNSQSDIKCP